MRLLALSTRTDSGLRARYSPRAIPIIVLDRWGHRGRLLLLVLAAPSALGRRRLRIHIHPSRVRVRAVPAHRGIDRGSTATRALRPTSFPARPAVTVGRRWR